MSPKATKYSVTITKADAETLVQLFWKIGGTLAGPRGAVDRLFEALQNAGVPPPNVGTKEVRFFMDHTYRQDAVKSEVSGIYIEGRDYGK